jgi:hypothetical protein
MTFKFFIFTPSIRFMVSHYDFITIKINVIKKITSVEITL